MKGRGNKERIHTRIELDIKRCLVTSGDTFASCPVSKLALFCASEREHYSKVRITRVKDQAWDSPFPVSVNTIEKDMPAEA